VFRYTHCVVGTSGQTTRRHTTYHNIHSHGAGSLQMYCRGICVERQGESTELLSNTYGVRKWYLQSLMTLHSMPGMIDCNRYSCKCAAKTSKAQWSLYVPPGSTFANSPFCPHSVFMCFVWIWEQTAIISLYNINWLVCITETECVHCAVRTGSLYIIQVTCFVWLSE
jgi:hypothetical protein